MKKTVVTGADGFIGSHLTEMLLAKGHSVKALVQYNSFGNLGWLENVSHPNLTLVAGDVRDPDFCRKLVEGAEVVFHLAALIAIPYSYLAPDSYIDTNVKGTLNMCQAVNAVGRCRLLVTSTSEVYGTAQYVPIDENHPKQPQSPYSASKIGADAIAKSFNNAFGLDVTIVRPFNTYGPRQSARAFIPSIITQIVSGKKEIKVGDLSPTRDFNYVEDTCRGFIAISECPELKGQEINIATQTEISMEETLKTIQKVMGTDVKWITDTQRLRPKTSEVYRLLGSNKKLTSMTGWTPEISFEEGIRKTVEWISERRNLQYYKPDIYNL